MVPSSGHLWYCYWLLHRFCTLFFFFTKTLPNTDQKSWQKLFSFWLHCWRLFFYVCSPDWHNEEEAKWEQEEPRQWRRGQQKTTEEPRGSILVVTPEMEEKTKRDSSPDKDKGRTHKHVSFERSAFLHQGLVFERPNSISSSAAWLHHRWSQDCRISTTLLDLLGFHSFTDKKTELCDYCRWCCCEESRCASTVCFQ